MLVRNVLCLPSGWNLWDLCSGGSTHVTAEIRKLGWKQIKKGPWIPNQEIWIFNSKNYCEQGSRKLEADSPFGVACSCPMKWSRHRRRERTDIRELLKPLSLPRPKVWVVVENGKGDDSPFSQKTLQNHAVIDVPSQARFQAWCLH